MSCDADYCIESPEQSATRKGCLDRRRESSRFAARDRRGKEADIFMELKEVVPIVDETAVATHVDRIALLRVAATLCRMRQSAAKFLRRRERRFYDENAARESDVYNGNSVSSDDSSCSSSGDCVSRTRSGNADINIEASGGMLSDASRINDAVVWTEENLAECLDGFALLADADGTILYVTESVNVFLGLTQTDLVGRHLKDFVLATDYDELSRAIIAAEVNVTPASSGIGAGAFTDKQVALVLRMKSVISPRGRTLNLKSALYKAIMCRCAFVVDGAASRRLTLIYGISAPAGQGTHLNGTLRANESASGAFTTRHTCDMRFTYVSENFNSLLRQGTRSLVGTSLYELVHPVDLCTLAEAMRVLFRKGHCITPYFRMLGANGSVVWCQTEATTVSHTTRGQKGQHVLCVHSVLGTQSEMDSWKTTCELPELSACATTTTTAGAAALVAARPVKDGAIKMETPDASEYFGRQPQFVDCADFTPLLDADLGVVDLGIADLGDYLPAPLPLHVYPETEIVSTLACATTARTDEARANLLASRPDDGCAFWSDNNNGDDGGDAQKNVGVQCATTNSDGGGDCSTTTGAAAVAVSTDCNVRGGGNDESGAKRTQNNSFDEMLQWLFQEDDFIQQRQQQHESGQQLSYTLNNGNNNGVGLSQSLKNLNAAGGESIANEVGYRLGRDGGRMGADGMRGTARNSSEHCMRGGTTNGSTGTVELAFVNHYPVYGSGNVDDRYCSDNFGNVSVESGSRPSASGSRCGSLAASAQASARFSSTSRSGRSSTTTTRQQNFDERAQARVSSEHHQQQRQQQQFIRMDSPRGRFVDGVEFNEEWRNNNNDKINKISNKTIAGTVLQQQLGDGMQPQQQQRMSRIDQYNNMRAHYSQQQYHQQQQKSQSIDEYKFRQQQQQQQQTIQRQQQQLLQRRIVVQSSGYSVSPFSEHGVHTVSVNARTRQNLHATVPIADSSNNKKAQHQQQQEKREQQLQREQLQQQCYTYQPQQQYQQQARRQLQQQEQQQQQLRSRRQANQFYSYSPAARPQQQQILNKEQFVYLQQQQNNTVQTTTCFNDYGSRVNSMDAIVINKLYPNTVGVPCRDDYHHRIESSYAAATNSATTAAHGVALNVNSLAAITSLTSAGEVMQSQPQPLCYDASLAAYAAEPQRVNSSSALSADDCLANVYAQPDSVLTPTDLDSSQYYDECSATVAQTSKYCTMDEYQECEQLGAKLAPFLPQEDMQQLLGDETTSATFAESESGDILKELSGLLPLDFDPAEFLLADGGEILPELNFSFDGTRAGAPYIGYDQQKQQQNTVPQQNFFETDIYSDNKQQQPMHKQQPFVAFFDVDNTVVPAKRARFATPALVVAKDAQNFY